MKSDWRVGEKNIGDQLYYGVYRLRDADAEDFYGNREEHSGLFEDRESAEEYCRILNAEIKIDDLIEEVD